MTDNPSCVAGTQAPQSAMAITGFVVGVIALLTSFIPIVNNISFFMALLALAFAIVGLVSTHRKTRRGKGLAVAGVIIAVLSGAIVLGSQSFYSAALDSVTSPSTTETQSSNQDAASTTAATSTTPDVPTEYKSALKKAQSYSDSMHMSKAGIYKQLTSEYGEAFSAEAAQYAMDNVKADWNANALAKAESYQSQMSMSPSAIHDQLISEYGEQFTEEEAQYAIANLSS